MLPDGGSDRGPEERPARVRHRPVPERTVGAEVIFARPSDGESMVLSPVASVLWRLLTEWTFPDDLDRRVAEAFPDVTEAERVAARTEILQMLEDDDLLERG